MSCVFKDHLPPKANVIIDPIYLKEGNQVCLTVIRGLEVRFTLKRQAKTLSRHS